MTETHTCNCTVCGGLSFNAPEGYISGTPKQIRDQVHNYAAMTRNPLHGAILATRGVEAA